MKYLSEYRDGALAAKMVERIKATSTKPARFMEICGTHTVALFKHGVRELLPDHTWENVLEGSKGQFGSKVICPDGYDPPAR